MNEPSSRDTPGDAAQARGGYSPARFTPAASQTRRKAGPAKKSSRGDSAARPRKPDASTAPDPGPRSARDASRESSLDAVRAVINRYELRAGGALPTSIAVTGVGRRADSARVARAFAEVLAEDLTCTTCLVQFGWLEGHPRTAAAVDDESPSGSYEFTDDEAIPLLTELTFGSLPARRRNAFVRSPEFAELLGELSDKYQHVVYHMPSVLDSPGAFVVMGHADAAVLVVKHRSTSLRVVERVRTTIEPTPTLAVVVTSYRPSIPRPLRRLFGS